jgi:hypothetical protein
MSMETGIVATLELLDDLLSPEVYGHAVPSDARTRVFVVREILRRELAALTGTSKPWRNED